MFFIASLLTGTAFSKVITDAELTYSTVNGTVAPKYRIRSECKIAKGIVTKVTTKAGVAGKPSSKKTKWTGLVADQNELGSLLSEAASGKIKGHSSPIGGRFESYQGTFKSSAKTLIELIDNNCN